MGAPEGGGGGEESGVNLPSAKKFFIAAMLLRDEDDIGTVQFYSVIYNIILCLAPIRTDENGFANFSVFTKIFAKNMCQRGQ